MLDIRGAINYLHASQRIFSFSYVIEKKKITSFLPLIPIITTYYLRFLIFWSRFGCTRGMKLKNNRLPPFVGGKEESLLNSKQFLNYARHYRLMRIINEIKFKIRDLVYCSKLSCLIFMIYELWSMFFSIKKLQKYIFVVFIKKKSIIIGVFEK